MQHMWRDELDQLLAHLFFDPSGKNKTIDMFDGGNSNHAPQCIHPESSRNANSSDAFRQPPDTSPMHMYLYCILKKVR